MSASQVLDEVVANWENFIAKTEEKRFHGRTQPNLVDIVSSIGFLLGLGN
jgi:hypothetical protein